MGMTDLGEDEQAAAIAAIIDERDALRARVEAAEALAYERLENALFAEQRANDTEAERDGLAARVAELEEAARWRPGSSPPDASGWYQVSGYDVGAYSLWYSGDASWHRSAYQGATYRSAAMGTPDFWRPIPPLPPQEAPAP